MGYMQMTQYNKLIRDRIPELIANEGKRCKTRVLSRSELQKHLIAKLREEVAEFEREPNLEEIADIVEVLRALANELGSDMNDLEQVRIEKYNKHGGFEKRLFLEYVD